MRTNLKLALRVLARRKDFTAISLVGISLTLVVLVVATAIVDNVFAPRQPQSRLERILVCSAVQMSGPHVTERSNPGRAFLRATMNNLPGAERLATSSDLESAVVYRGGSRLEVRVRRTDGEYWRVFDHPFLEGSPYTKADIDSNRAVAIITDRVREQVFGRTPAVGRDINIGGQLYRVGGVVARVPISQIWAYADVWMPLPLPTSEENQATFGRLYGVVLANSEADIRPIKREFAARVARFPLKDPKVYTEVRAYL